MSRISAMAEAVVRLYRRSGLTLRGLIALAAAALTVGGALLVLAGTSEDVVEHNGLSMDDPGWLRFVSDHRFGWLVDLARVLAEAGSVAVLGLVAAAVAGVLWWRGTCLALAIAPGLALGLAGACAAMGKA